MNKKRYNIFKQAQLTTKEHFNSLKEACEWGGLNYNSVRASMSRNKKKVYTNQVYILRPKN